VPTYERDARFDRDFANLTLEQRARFRTAVASFVRCLKAQQFDPGLRVKAVQGAQGIWEMTWAPNGRATFSYGIPRRPSEAHIIWRRIGTHDVFRQP
jgi:hypothetical protein